MKQYNVPCWLISSIVSSCAIAPVPALAQVIPDGTTPTDAGTCGAICIINGGTVRGANLFHSFQDFNVNNGQAVRFTNPDGIANVLSRVTGGNPSTILGTLGVNGAANLFLLNPNGIIFGPDAQLDVRGSFLATTADSFLFPDSSEFSAVNPQAAPLLAINVPIGLQYGTTATDIFSQATLAVDPGQRLALVGGAVVLDESRLFAPGGRVELGGVGGVGTVELNDGFSLRFPETLARADVLLNAAEVNVRSLDVGEIAITAQTLDLLAGSRVRAGIAEGLGGVGSQAGDITLDATDTIRIGGASGISNAVLDAATGNAGNVFINTGSLSISDGSFVSTDVFNFAQGNAGDIVINTNALTVASDSLISARAFGTQGTGGNIAISARSLLVTDRSFVSTDAVPSEAEASPNPKNAGMVRIRAIDAVTLLNQSEISAFSNLGNGGDILIEANQLLVDTSNIDSYGAGGDAGDVTIRAANSVTLTDSRNLPVRGARIGAFTRESSGAAGRIVIETGNLTLRNYSVLATSDTAGFAGARSGEIVVRATEAIDLNNSDLSVISLVDGTGGRISIESGRLTVQNLSAVGASGVGTGSSGDIEIITGQLRVLSGGQITAQTASGTRGGDLTIRASDFVEVVGSGVETASELVDEPTSFLSRIGTDSNGSGDAGNLRIDTRWLLIRDGAQVGASAFGAGRGGRITVNASELVEITGVAELLGIASGGFLASNLSTLSSRAGDAGDVFINTGRLILRDGGLVLARTFGAGQGGRMIINAANTVEIVGFSSQTRIPSSLLVDTSGTGNAGELLIDTERLSIQDGGTIFAQTSNSGRGGTVNLSASDLVEVVGTSANGSTRSTINVGTGSGTGAGGRLAIATNRLNVNNGGLITVSTFGAGDAGELIINADESVNVIGTSANGRNSSEINAGTDSNARGRGGDLFISTQQLTVQDQAEVTVSSPDGQAGNLSITANAIRLNQGRLTAETGQSGDEAGANITLQGVDLLSMRDRSLISAEANGNANGGNITIDAADGFIIATPPGNPGSDIIANADRGNGGNIDITTQSLFGIEFRDRLTPDNDITASSRIGLAGTVAVNTPDVDPSRGLTALPTNLADASNQIVRSCSTNTTTTDELGNFVITGRGGLPMNPTEPLESEEVLTEWVSGGEVEGGSPIPLLPVYAPIVEAQTIAIASNGQVTLTAQALEATSSNPWQSFVCVP